MTILDHTWSILKLLIFIGVYISIILKILVSRVHKHVSDNWSEHRKNPMFIPRAGAFRRDGDSRSFTESTGSNFKSWLWTTGKNFFNVLMKPIKYILTLIHKIITKFRSILDTLRAQAKAIRNMFSNIVGQVAEKMSNTTAAIKFYQAKMTDIVKRQKAVFQLILYMAKAMKMTFDSLIKGPIPAIARFFPMFGILLLVMIALCIVCFVGGPFVKLVTCPICAVDMASVAAVAVCFDKNTPITLANRKCIPIESIQLGQRLLLGGDVLSTLRFRIQGRRCPVYSYRGVVVSGSHLVYTLEGPKRIQDCSEAQLLTEGPSELYCVITEDHRICSGSLEFADFYECGCVETNATTMNFVQDALNAVSDAVSDQRSPTASEPHVYAWGFQKGTEIEMEDGSFCPIEAIPYEARVRDGGAVYGIICHATASIRLYDIGDNIGVSGTQLVLHQGVWVRAYTLPGAREILDPPHSITYSLATEQHCLRLQGGIQVRDYMEIEEDHPVFDKIHLANLQASARK